MHKSNTESLTTAPRSASAHQSVSALLTIATAAYDVTVRLSRAGAQFLSEESGHPHCESAETVITVLASSALEATRTGGDFGSVIAIVPNDAAERLWREKKQALLNAHPDCAWCQQPIEQIEHGRAVFTSLGVRLVHSLRTCLPLYTAFESHENALAGMRRAS